MPWTFDNFGDYAHFQAASHARVAESLQWSMRLIVALVHPQPSSSPDDAEVLMLRPSLDDILTILNEATQRNKLLSSVSAAQAVAWDHMQAHRGSDDLVGYSDYGAATELHSALILNAPDEANEDADGGFPT